MYLDFTNRCFFRLQVFFFWVSPAAGCDGDETVVDDSWLVDGDGEVSSSASAEGRPPHSCAQGRPWQELDEVDSAVDSSEPLVPFRGEDHRDVMVRRQRNTRRSLGHRWMVSIFPFVVPALLSTQGT